MWAYPVEGDDKAKVEKELRHIWDAGDFHEPGEKWEDSAEYAFLTLGGFIYLEDANRGGTDLRPCRYGVNAIGERTPSLELTVKWKGNSGATKNLNIPQNNTLDDLREKVMEQSKASSDGFGVDDFTCWTQRRARLRTQINLLQ